MPESRVRLSHSAAMMGPFLSVCISARRSQLRLSATSRLEGSAKAANYEIVTIGPIKPLPVQDHLALVVINHLPNAKHGFSGRNCKNIGKVAICRGRVNLLVSIAKNHIVFVFEEGEK